MDFASLIAAVGSVGFPIVMCLVLFVYNQKADMMHDDEIKALTQAIAENTKELTRLIDKMVEKGG
jgi:hypothetical protein